MVTFARTLAVTDSYPIDEVSYDFKTQTLRVRFPRTNSTWDYDGVPAWVFARLAGAYSVGQAFNELVRNRYDATRVAPTVKKVAKR